MSGREPSRVTDRLSESWHAEIPEDQWPDALIAAIRVDVGALSAARAIQTIRAWRSALTGPEPGAREAARARLAMLAEALTSDAPARPMATERLDTIALLAPRPSMPPASPDRPTDSAVPVLTAPPSRRDVADAIHRDPSRAPTPAPAPPELTAWAYGQPGWAPEDESGDDIDPLLSDLAGQVAVPRAPSVQLAALDLLDLDDDDTAHIDGGAPLPPARPRSRARSSARADEPARRAEPPVRRASAGELPPRRTSAASTTTGTPLAPSTRSEARAAPIAMPPLTLPPPPPVDEFADEPPTTAVPIFPIRTSAPPPLVPQRPQPPPLPPSSTVGPPPTPPPLPSVTPRATSAERRPAGRPQVVRRATAQVAPLEPPRPRAALVQVRALYTAILPLCRELVPLSPERRSRRFWTHWREASGDRGVRREVAEQVLETARDVRGLASDLIAEVQSVDPESVRILIDRLDAEADQTEGALTPRTPERPGEDRARAPLVGAVVRVEDLPFEPES